MSEHARATDKLRGGHLFIIDGDLTQLACDAILIPTDEWFSVTSQWRHVVPRGSFVEDWNGSDMLRVETSPSSPDVWLGNVGLSGDDSDFEPFAIAAEHFVTAAQAHFQRSKEHRSSRWVKPRLAVNLIGSGFGGAGNRKGRLAAGLIPTLQSLAHKRDVDLVLVTFGAKPYAAAQRARRSLVDMNDLAKTWRFRPDANPQLIGKARSLADEAVRNHLVLFMGAGVSAGAGLPMWKELLTDVAVDAGIDPRMAKFLEAYDPRDQATVIETRLEDPDAFRNHVASRLKAFPRYSLAHGLLASLPSKEAITTNFDDLFERAVNVGERRLAVLPTDPRAADGRWLLKLHGSVTDPAGIVLTRHDYLNMPRQYGALMGLVQALLMLRHMLFVGYSLSDEDFHELVHELRSARGNSKDVRQSTVLTLVENPAAIELWKRELDIVPMMMSDHGEADLDVAARELEIFLDLVGFLATTAAPFFLDDTFAELTQDEAGLREVLSTLAWQTRGAELGSVGYLVEQFLASLGGRSNFDDDLGGRGV